MNEPNPDQLEQRIRRLLDTRVGQLDAGTLSRLRQARRHALDHAKSASTAGDGNDIYRGVGVATAGLLLALGLTVWLRGDGFLDSPSPQELEMLADTEELMLYRDLDFYLWLQQREGDVSSDPSSEPPKI